MNVEELIIETFKKAVNMIEENKKYTSLSGKPKIIYPCYSQELGSGETRISEQEIKQLFIQTLIEDQNDFYFSVETPTGNRYGDFSSDNPKVYCDKNEENGRSACLDLCIHDLNKDKSNKKKFIRKHLIEFKANNPDEKDIKKDFLKLFLEEQEQEQLDNYFIHILDSATNNTIKSIKRKYYNSWYYCTNNSCDECSKYNSCAYSTWTEIKAKNTIIVYLLIINNKTERKSSNDQTPSGYYRIVLKPETPEDLQLGIFCNISFDEETSNDDIRNF